MDFLQTSFRQEILHTTNINAYDGEFEFEDEHDVLYGELRRQVLQLTAEEEEDVDKLYENKNRNMGIEVRKGSTNTINSCSLTQAKWYYDWPGNEDSAAPPTWILNLWRTGNGTGVFIPKIVQSMRSNRSRRKKNERGRRTYKRVEKMN